MNPFQIVPGIVYRIALFVLIPAIAAILWFHDPDAILECARAEDLADVRDCAEDVELDEATRDAVDKIRRLEELGE